MVCYLIEQAVVLTLFGMKHGFTDGSHDLLLVESYNAPVALNYSLNHIYKEVLVSLFTFHFLLKAKAYILICFTIASSPLLRVGERCSFSPISSMK